MIPKGRVQANLWRESGVSPGPAKTLATLARLQLGDRRAARKMREAGEALTARQVENDKRPDRLLRKFSWETEDGAK